MSEMDGRTEPATPKRKAEERKKGHVCKTPELNSALILFTGFILINKYSRDMIENLKMYIYQVLYTLPYKSFTNEYLNRVARDTIFVFFKSVAPFLITILIVGLLANIAQVRFVFSFEYMKNMSAKFNLGTGIKKMFSLNSFVILFKDLLKASVVILLGYNLIKNNLLNLMLFTGQEPAVILDQILKFIYQFGSRTALVMLVIAAIDYLYQKKQYEKSMMMTKQEIKDEMKNQEGDPLIKSRIRGKQIAMSRKRMMNDVPTADVVVTNPTMFAVALKYQSDYDAPIMVAKGVRLIAQKIKEVALENDIPVVENVFIAQTLYWQAEVGQKIPPFLYHAVAEILAYVYRLKNKFATVN